jgi:enterochelin esterase-like enzyme
VKARTIWIGVFTAALLCWMSASTRAQEPQALFIGMNEERTLRSGENHLYTITLQDGTAVVGEADQHGIDLVIDIFGPDGKLFRTVDSSNGAEGSEPIDLTAIKAGVYKLVVHAIDPAAKPGKYLMKIDRVLTVEENGQRMAEKNYPPALQELWRAYVTDPKAVENFVASRRGKGPIIEDLKGDSKNVSVTYLYYGDEYTESVETSGGPHAAVGGIQMTRFMRTPLFFATESVPKDARYGYDFGVTETHFAGPTDTIQLSEENYTSDPLNPEALRGHSILTMPAAPPQPYIVRNDSTPQGRLTPTNIKSIALNEDRGLTIYTPPGYEGTKACDLLIVFDGEYYDGSGTSSIPTPTILDNLIAAKKISPTVAVFVNNTSHRDRDLTGYAPFADFIGKELVPWVRKNYHISPGASHVVAAGSSFGGLSASYSAFRHSEVIGGVLSQSGAYWVTKDWQTSGPWPLTEDTGDLVKEFRKSKRLPIRFYMEVGRFDEAGFMLGTNREFRDVLLLKGYPVTYREFDGAHNYIWWRGSLAEGLTSLIGRKDD